MRIERFNEKYGIAYGMDTSLGIFITIWKLDSEYLSTDEKNNLNADNIIIDRDTVNDALTTKILINVAREHGFQISDRELKDMREFNSKYEN